jgi:hypothetical protein
MRIPVTDIKAYDGFSKGPKEKDPQKRYESRCHKPSEIGGWVFVTVWDIDKPRGQREMLKFPKDAFVYLRGKWIDEDGME